MIMRPDERASLNKYLAKRGAGFHGVPLEDEDWRNGRSP